MTSPTHGDLVTDDHVELLQAVHEVTRAPDQPSFIRSITETAHRVLGFQRVRFYVMNSDDELIHKRYAVGIGAEDQEPPRLLSSSHLLGQAALSQGGPHICNIADLGDSHESEGGTPTCLLSVPLPLEGRGILVADNPQSTVPISPTAAQGLALLAGLASCSVAHSERGRMGVEFVSKVSHELRTPLTSIRAFTEMLLDGDAGALNEKQTRYVSRVDNGAGMLLRLVEDLLELTYLESGNRPLQQNRILIKPFLDDILFNLSPRVDEKSISIRVEVADNIPMLVTDQQRLQQAVTNLVDNAIKYSPEASLVKVAASCDAEGLRLAVVDGGPGIHPNEQEKVFTAFYRAYEGKASLENKGSGLGLSIVSSITHMLGAYVELQSEPGKGSTFALVFPLQYTAEDSGTGEDDQ